MNHTGSRPRAVFGPDGLRPCLKCEQRLSRNDFAVDRTTTDGLNTRCKSCMKEYRHARIVPVRAVADGETKKCTKCEKILPLTAEYFHFNHQLTAQLDSWCKECRKDAAKVWLQDNTTKGRAARRKWKLRVKFGITPEIYAEMSNAQRGVCAICGNGPEPKQYLDIDHCHKTGKVRGLLCNMCNRSIGSFSDSTKRISSMIRYLGGNLTILSNDFEPVPFPLVNAEIRRRTKRLNLTVGSYRLLWESHGGRCAVCRCPESSSGRTVNIDHDHATGKIRGLLCTPCNVTIGRIGDSIPHLERMIAYLSRTEISSPAV